MNARSAFLLLMLAFGVATSAAAGGRVIFVDNSRAEEGSGSFEHPFKRLPAAQAVSGFGDVIYVAEGNAPYVEGIELKRGQMLVGSAYGLEALRADLKVQLDAPIVAAVQGPGPIISATINAAGDNLIAGCTIATDRAAGVVAQSPQGKLSIRNVWFRPSGDAFAIAIQEAIAPVSISGGGIIATARGSGIAIYGGTATVTIEHFPMSGEFGSAVYLANRTRGSVRFSGGSPIKVADAAHDVITVTNVTAPVAFDDRLDITTHGGRGLVIDGAKKLFISDGSSRIRTTNGAAVAIRNSTVDIVLESVSAEPAPPGRVASGITITGMHGRFTVTGVEKDGAGSGGTIRNAALHGIELTQSEGIKIANVTLIDDGRGERAKCDEEVEAKTNLQCRAALYLRHIAHSEFSNITVSGGKQIGLNANNLEDVTFGGLEIRGSGDGPADAAVVIDEIRGVVRFDRCVFEDATGGAIVVAQQFNAGKLLVEHCSIGSPGRPSASQQLINMRTSGAAALDVDLRSVDVHDNAASAIRADAIGTSTMRLTIADSRFQRFGRTAVQVSAREEARAAVVMQRASVVTPGSADPAAVVVSAANGGSVCVSIDGGHFVTAAAGAPVRVATSSPRAKVSIVRHAAPSIEVPGNATVVTSCP